jgi:hypothetical protein
MDERGGNDRTCTIYINRADSVVPVSFITLTMHVCKSSRTHSPIPCFFVLATFAQRASLKL